MSDIEKECCGQCGDKEEKNIDYKAAFDLLVQDFAKSIGEKDAVITGLIMKAGGSVELTEDEVKAINGNTWAMQADDTSGVFRFSVGAAPVPTEH